MLYIYLHSFLFLYLFFIINSFILINTTTTFMFIIQQRFPYLKIQFLFHNKITYIYIYIYK